MVGEKGRQLAHHEQSDVQPHVQPHNPAHAPVRAVSRSATSAQRAGQRRGAANAIRASADRCRSPSGPNQSAAGRPHATGANAAATGNNLVHGQRGQSRKRWTQRHRHQRCARTDRECTMIRRDKSRAIAAMLACAGAALSCGVAGAPPAAPAPAVRSDASAIPAGQASPAPSASVQNAAPAAGTSPTRTGET